MHRPVADVQELSARAAPPIAHPARPAAATRGPGSTGPLLVLLAVPVLVTAWGLPYYSAPLAQRLRHPLHALLKSSGPVGLAFGVLALALFLFM